MGAAGCVDHPSTCFRRWVRLGVRAPLLATLVPLMSSSPDRSRRPPLLETAPGTRQGPFGFAEWALLVGIVLVWGSSYILIDIGLEAFEPPLVTWIRVTLGFVVLVGFPAARKPVDRSDWGRVAVLGITWPAVGFLLGPISQQHISSAMAGMINSLVPIFSAIIAMLLLRTLPRLRQAAGILLGFAGSMMVGLPASQGSPAAAWGILLAVVAAVLYGLSFNVSVPLQQRYGAPAVMMWALGLAAVLTAPFGVAALRDSVWTIEAVVAVTVLGVLNTGLAFVMVTLFAGRVGPTRGSVPIYFLPVVAMVLGVLVRGDTVLPLQVAGTSLVLLGAFAISLREV